MKLPALFAAAMVLAGVSPIAAAPAAAQRTVVTERTVVRHDGPRYRPAYRHRTVTRRVCTNRWWGGRSHRVCRTVRRYR